MDRNLKMEPTLRSTQVLKQYVREKQALDSEEKAAWRDGQKFYVEKEKRADEIQMAQIEAVKRQAKIAVEKEPALKN